MPEIHDQVRKDYQKILLDPSNSLVTDTNTADTMSAFPTASSISRITCPASIVRFSEY